jgi:hypothetical protein
VALPLGAGGFSTAASGEPLQPLFARLAYRGLLAACLGSGLLRLIPAMVAIVVRDGLGDFFRG